MYTNFLFIVSFIVIMNAMTIIKPISIKLQRRSSDIVNAYHEVAGVVRELSEIRASDRMLHDWYTQAEVVAADVYVVPAVTEQLLSNVTVIMLITAQLKSTTEEQLFRCYNGFVVIMVLSVP